MQKCVFCPIAPGYNFSATMASTYSTRRLGLVTYLKFLATENMPPYFSAHVYYGQTTEWIRRHFVRWGRSSSHAKGHSRPPTFRPTALARIPAGPHFTHSRYCRLGNARPVALVAILPDNCHPFSS